MSLFLQQTINGLLIGGTYALMAVGFTLIFGVLRFVYLAHGEVMMLGAYVGLFTLRWVPSVPLALLAAMMCTALVGLLIERLTLRPLIGYHHLMPLVTTVSAGILIQEVLRLTVNNGQPVTYPRAVRVGAPVLTVGPVNFSSIQLTILVVSFALMLVLTYLVNRTRLGRAIRSIAQSPDLATLLGVNVGRISAFTFALACALAGATGVLFGLMFPTITPYVGDSFNFKALAIVLFGGLGSLPGAVFGGLLLGVVEALAVGYLQSSLRDIFAFAVMMLILFVRPNGLFGSRVRLD